MLYMLSAPGPRHTVNITENSSSDSLLRFTKMVKCLPEFEYFTVFLKNKNIIFKTRRSKVTDYASLTLITRNITQQRPSFQCRRSEAPRIVLITLHNYIAFK